MKRFLLLIAALFTISICFGQEGSENSEKKELENLKKMEDSFIKLRKTLTLTEEIYENYFKSIEGIPGLVELDSLVKKINEVEFIKAKVDSIYYDIQAYERIYLKEGLINEKDIENNLKESSTYGVEIKQELPLNKEDEGTLLEEDTPKDEDTSDADTLKDADTPIDEVAYLYFNKEGLIELKDFERLVKENVFFDILFSRESKTYLGDFIIPMKGQLIAVYKNSCFNRSKSFFGRVICSEKITRNEDRNFNGNLSFREVNFSIYEGSFKNINVILEDRNNGEIFVYENLYPVSLLRFSTIAPKTALVYKTSQSLNKERITDTNYHDTKIRLSDVFTYIANPSDNYVPDDLRMSLPEANSKNDSITIYKIEQDTSFQNVVELRAFTDFLALFGESNNGLVQIEGKADIFVNPFNFANTRLFIFKKITPFVSFSRLDEEKKFIQTIKTNGGFSLTKNDKIDNRLTILEKAYLDMGIRLNLFSYSFSKESPFTINGYFPVRYLIGDMIFESETIPDNISNQDFKIHQLKSLGLGFGLHFEFKRFNNFIFNASVEFTKFRFRDLNEIEGFVNPDSFGTSAYEAEIAYYPSKMQNHSMFVRMRVVNNSAGRSDDSFYQFQFGYKFTIPLNKKLQ